MGSEQDRPSHHCARQTWCDGADHHRLVVGHHNNGERAMRHSLAFLGIGATSAGLAICIVVYRNGADMAALASAATMAAGLLLFLASRAFKSGDRA